MRIVMIRSNPVRPDSRVEKEAFSLTKGGHKVVILCWDRDGNHKAVRETLTVAGVKIPIVRIGFQAGYSEGKKSIVPFTKYQLAMCAWLLKNKKKFDVIHACDFDMAFFPFLFAKLFQKKFVFDVFDFLVAKPRNLFQRIVKKAHFLIMNHADATIICTEERKKQIAGAKPKKLAVIHNAPFAAQMGNGEILQKKPEKISVAYVGILQDNRLLMEISHFFEKNPEYEWQVGGFGKYHDYFTAMSEKCPNITYYGRIPYEDTLALENSCDIMLAIYEPSSDNHRFAAPNKFYEALMLGKPLIMVRGTGMSEIVEKEKIGVLITYSEEGFADGVRQLVSCREQWEKMGKRMRELYQKEYCWEMMELRLKKLYDEI